MNIHVLPKSPPDDIIEWLDNSGLKVDGHTFQSSLNPQGIRPIRCMFDSETRIGTYVKPVQSGGSTAGEAVVAAWCKFRTGSIQENWQDDEVAEKRWKDRTLPSLESIGLDWAGGKDSLICEARFVNATLRLQGVWSEKALNSDTIVHQRNEEVHLWKPGHLSMARDRQTRVWNSKALDISNASKQGDQLHNAFESGTMEQWENFCPKCGQPHAMRFRYNPNKPQLGGLRWDSSGCKMDGGKFDYNRLAKTLRYEFPCCGHVVLNEPLARRQLRGDYSAPTNPGATPSHKSWISDAVSYDQIDWLMLVKEWHAAIRALKAGDTEPMYRFVTRRECSFWSPESIPYSGDVIYNTNSKTREGMPNAIMRIAVFDWQKGYKAKSELEHYWGLIPDVDADANSKVVWEGKANSDAELLAEVDAHNVERRNVWIDCTGVQKRRLLQFCYQNGLNAISLDLSRQGGFLHADKVRRFYSEAKPIHRELGQGVIPVYEYQFGHDAKGKEIRVPHPDEPIVVELHKAGLLAFYFFIRNMRANVMKENPQATPADYISIDIPHDVSEDFKTMLESWEMIPGHKGSAKDESVDGFRPRSRFDHQLLNMAVHCFILEWTICPDSNETLVGRRLAQLGIRTEETK